MTIKTINEKFNNSMKQLIAEHKTKVAAVQTALTAVQTALADLKKFNNEVWRPTRQKLMAERKAEKIALKESKKTAKKSADVKSVDEVVVKTSEPEPLVHARVGEIDE